jgi:hypothetical protein
MIRNYYTEAFKNGVVPVVSATQLIDGTVKITDSTTATGVVNAITSTTFILGAINGAIQVGMYLTAPASGGAAAITINDEVMVAAVVHGLTATTVTLNKPRQTAAGQNLTFFNVNQNSWREYSLFIGTQPSQGLISETANAAAAAQPIVTWKVSNPYIQVGMNVYDDGVLIGVVGTVTTANQISLVANLAALIANDSVLTFSFSVLPSVSVLTIDNKTVTFTNPAQGFVLPVSVVQVTAVAGGLSNLIALD